MRLRTTVTAAVAAAVAGMMAAAGWGAARPSPAAAAFALVAPAAWVAAAWGRGRLGPRGRVAPVAAAAPAPPSIPPASPAPAGLPAPTPTDGAARRASEADDAAGRERAARSAGLWVADADARTTFVNAGLAALLGYDPARMLGRPMADFVAAADRPALAAAIERVRRGAARQHELPFRRADGAEVWLLWCGEAAFDARGAFAGVCGAWVDVTAHRRARHEQARLNQIFLSLGRDTDQNIHRLTEVCGELLGATCSVYSRLGDGKVYAVGHWQAPRRHRRRAGGGAAAPSAPEGAASGFDEAAAARSGGQLCHDVLRLGPDRGAYVVEDLQQTPYLGTDPNVAAWGLRTFAGHPVRRGGKALGSLCVAYQAAVDFDADRQHLLATLATAIGVEEERQRGEWLENDRRQVLEMVALNQPLDQTLERITGLLGRQLPDLPASVLLLQDGRLTHAAALNVPQDLRQALDERATALAGRLRAGAAGRGLDDREMVLVSDLARDPLWADLRELTGRHGLRACCSLPILTGGGEAAGLLMLFSREAQCLGDDDLALLRTLGRLAAIAVEQRQMSDQIIYRAQHDPLTGLPNRVLFEDRLQVALPRARRQGQSVGLFFIDLDRFKVINDTLGHHAGDELLQQVTHRFKECVRASDTLVRLGGDEFALVLPDLKDRDGAVRVAQALGASLRPPFQIAEHEFFCSASIGISIFPQDAADAADLQRNADAAMYRAKGAGKNTFQCFSPEMNAAAMEKLALENEFRRALDNHELQLYYQPVVDRGGGLYALESLIRWNHPKRGMISPAKFIPVAEETGLIVPMGAWVLREACRQNRAWRDAGRPALPIAVNVSALQFAQGDFVQTVIDAYAEQGLPPGALMLEITESLLMSNTAAAAVKLARLREMGISVAIDDFGTGYSSLAYLQNLPVDVLKIDRSFVSAIQPRSGALACPPAGTATPAPADADQPPRLDAGPHPGQAFDGRTAVIRAITSLAHTLGMRVVAEGVETEEQRAFLLAIGCDGLQGYLFSRPVPAAQAEPLLARRFMAELEAAPTPALAMSA